MRIQAKRRNFVQVTTEERFVEVTTVEFIRGHKMIRSIILLGPPEIFSKNRETQIEGLEDLCSLCSFRHVLVIHCGLKVTKNGR